MKINYEIEIEPFRTPNYVCQKPPVGFKEGSALVAIPLKDIDVLTLKDMCDEFTHEVLKKAGKLT